MTFRFTPRAESGQSSNKHGGGNIDPTLLIYLTRSWQAIRQIVRRPTAGAVYLSGPYDVVRRVLLKKTRNHVYFTVHEGEIVILSVWGAPRRRGDRSCRIAPMSLPAPLEGLRRQTGMYVNPPTFDGVVAFIDGYDMALSGGLLVGFREWLIVRANEGNNLTWGALVASLIDHSHGRDDKLSIARLFATLDEFVALRTADGGLRRIYVHYERWLRTQDWYTPTSPNWIAEGD
jgi:hypothetical protein